MSREISVWVSARGSVLKRRLGMAEGAAVGARGEAEICSRPPWLNWTSSLVPWAWTASARRR